MHALAIAASLSSIAWTWEHPTPTGATITAAASRGATIYVAGDRGALHLSTNGGAAWRPLASGTNADLHAVTTAGTSGGSGGNLVIAFAVGERGTILRARDGVTFEARPGADPQASLIAIAATSAAVFVLAQDGHVLRSTNGGDAFVPRGATQDTLSTAIAIAPSGIFAAGVDGVYRSTDDGATFTRVVSESVQRLAVAADGTLYALASTRVTYPHTHVCGSCIDVGYETVALYRSTDGATWQRRTLADPTAQAPAKTPWGPAIAPTPPTTPPTSIQFGRGPWHAPLVGPAWRGGTLVIEANGEIVAGNDVRWSSRDRGATWSPTTRTPLALDTLKRRTLPAELFALAATPSGRVFAGGMAGTLLTREPSTAAWSRVTIPTSEDQRLEAIHALDDKTILVAGEDGLLLASTDGGATFAHRATGTVRSLTTLWSSGDEVFAAGHQVVLHSKDRGSSWRTMATESSIRRLWGTADDLFALGDEVLRSRDRGATWTAIAKVPIGDYLGAHASGDAITLVGNEGRIVQSADRGKTWVTRASGTRLTLSTVVGRGEDLYVAGGNHHAGIVLRSRDRGKTWREELVPASASMFSLAITPSRVVALGAGAALLSRPVAP